jgi:hypothetical protein
MDKFLHFVYTGELMPFDESEMPILLEIGYEFEMEIIKSYCGESLSETMNEQTVTSLAKTAKKYDSQVLMARCFSFMMGEDSLKEDIFKIFSPDDFYSIIQLDDLATSETEVFNFVVAFGKQLCEKDGVPMTGETLKKYAGFLLAHVRYPILPAEFVAETVHPLAVLPACELLDAYNHLALPKKFHEHEEVPVKYRQRKCPTKFVFDSETKGSNITISNGGLTVRKSGSSYEAAIGDRGFIRGRHYWEVVIDQYRESEDMWFGVCKKPIDCNANSPPLTGNFWSFLCSYGNKCFTTRESYYRTVSTNGHRVGVFLDMDRGVLGFFHNGTYLGDAFTNIPTSEPLFPAVNMYYEGGQVSIDFPRIPAMSGAPPPVVPVEEEEDGSEYDEF